MIEDKLSREERIRLECIAQANAFAASRFTIPSERLVDIAADFEAYIKEGKK